MLSGVNWGQLPTCFWKVCDCYHYNLSLLKAHNYPESNLTPGLSDKSLSILMEYIVWEQGFAKLNFCWVISSESFISTILGSTVWTGQKYLFQIHFITLFKCVTLGKLLKLHYFLRFQCWGKNVPNNVHLRGLLWGRSEIMHVKLFTWDTA